KAQGIVGELNTGYLGYVVEKPTADVKALVEDINAKRKAFYQQTAVKTGATLEQVAATAYLKAVEKTETGNYYQNSSGNWQKK
ncbi:MAG: YdbL family protein, partial [Pseudomonadales bacterium]|nr:YdbL family protein [Pseudomonadales bacterium]